MCSQAKSKLYQNQKEYIDFQQESQYVPDDSIIQNKCFNCGWGVSDTADICENCSEWLLKGKCNFCYSDVEEGQKFCSECGNPPEGINCHSCGALSHFDFCPQCNIAVTEQATETIELIRNSIEFQNLLNISNNENFSTHEKNDQSEIELKKLKNYLSKFSKQKIKKADSFAIKSNFTGKIQENLNAVEQSKLSVQKEEQRISAQQQKETQALKLLEDIRNKTFSSNQEARKFSGSLKILLPKIIIKRKPIGWKCNFVGVLHSDGPQSCGDPSQGGTWIYDDIEEEEYLLTEI